jgi:hypothetical protein
MVHVTWCVKIRFLSSHKKAIKSSFLLRRVWKIEQNQILSCRRLYLDLHPFSQISKEMYGKKSSYIFFNHTVKFNLFKSSFKWASLLIHISFISTLFQKKGLLKHFWLKLLESFNLVFCIHFLMIDTGIMTVHFLWIWIKKSKVHVIYCYVRVNMLSYLTLFIITSIPKQMISKLLC